MAAERRLMAEPQGRGVEGRGPEDQSAPFAMAGPNDPCAKDMFHPPAVEADEGRPQENDGDDGEVATLSNGVGDTVPPPIF